MGCKPSHYIGLEAFFLLFLAAEKSYQGQCNVWGFGCQFFLWVALFFTFCVDVSGLLCVLNIIYFKYNIYKVGSQVNIWFLVGLFMVGFENVWTFTGVRTSDSVSELRQKMRIVCCFPVFLACDEWHTYVPFISLVSGISNSA